MGMAVLVKELLIFYLIMINNRVEFIDNTKGIAILLMIISHCVVGYGPLKTWISSFNMPIFFVICGYLCYLKHPQGISLSRSTSYLKKRVLNLWKPYIIFCFILIAFFNALKFLSGASTTILPQIKNDKMNQFIILRNREKCKIFFHFILSTFISSPYTMKTALA